jgi:hypothetical protein
MQLFFAEVAHVTKYPAINKEGFEILDVCISKSRRLDALDAWK